MTTVIGDITMSLDGFVTGPDPKGGRDIEDLHTWALTSDDPLDAEVLRAHTAASGSVVMGRRTWDQVDAPDGWNDDIGYGAREVAQAAPSFFVVTSEPPDSVRLDIDVSFVPSVEEAVSRARDAAGELDVFVMGGGATVGSCLAAGLLDELRIHLAPEVLGAGTPLFENVGRHRLQQQSVQVSGTAVHLTYRVRR